MPHSRRRFLAIAAGLAGLSGCPNRSSTDPASTTATPTGTATDAPTTTPSPQPTPDHTPTPEPFDGRWPTFGGDARNTGVAPAAGPLRPTVDWRYETAERITTAPVVADGTVVIGSIDATLHGVSARDGRERWRFDLPSPPNGTPAVHGGRVLLETRDHGIYALDAGTGEFAWWRSTTTPNRPGDITVYDGTAYVAVDGAVVGFDTRTGGVRRRIPFEQATARALAVADDVLYVAWEGDDGTGEPRTGGLDAVGLDAERRWRAEPGYPLSAPTVADGTVVWTTNEAAHAYDAATGEERWRFEPANGTGSPAVADGAVYLGSRETAFHALDLDSGDPIWSVETTSRPSVAPVVADETVYYGSGAHRVYGHDAATGERRWSQSIDWLPSDPALAGGTLFVAGNTELHALRDA